MAEVFPYKSQTLLGILPYSVIILGAFSALFSTVLYGMFQILSKSKCSWFTIGSEWTSTSVLIAVLILLPRIPLLNTVLGIAMLPAAQSRKRGRVRNRKLSQLYICIVTKGNNIVALQRTCNQALAAAQFDPRLETVILTAVPYLMQLHEIGIRVEATPTRFSPRNAKYKAKNLEYCRKVLRLRDDDWVLHLDEDSLIDEHALRACIEFIECEPYDFGQGFILYNSHHYWRNAFLSVMDIPRVVDEFGKYYFQNRIMHSSFHGVRGSFLLTSGKIENAIGWDTACLTEDYDFAWKAWKKGFRCGWISGICREQSPTSFYDSLQQRRRWYHGAWQAGLTFRRPQFILELLSTFAPIFVLLLSVYPQTGISLPRSAWSALAGAYCIELSAKCLACLLQDIDAQVPVASMMHHQLAVVFLSYPAEILERFLCLYGLLFPPKCFHVVRKQ